MSKFLVVLAASSALALAVATPALAQPHNGWASDSNQGGSTKDCSVSPNPGCTTVEQPKGQATDPPKENNSPKDCSGPPGQQAKQCK
jgi:uncharacterized protein YdeI (BOF family)